MDIRELLTGVRATTLPQEVVPTPELGDGASVIVRGMSGTDRNSYESALMVGKGRKSRVDMADITAKLLVRCIVREDGTRVFRDDETALVGKIRSDVLGRLSDVAQRLCGLTEEDLEDLGKSLPTAPGTSSSTN